MKMGNCSLLEAKWERDEKEGNVIYYENSDGCWSKSKHNEKGNVIYYENNKGKIIDEKSKRVNYWRNWKVIRLK